MQASSLYTVRIMALSRILLGRRTARYSEFASEIITGVKVHAACALQYGLSDAQPSSWYNELDESVVLML